MFSIEPLIVGIDPGTTTGLALLDLNGEIIKIISKKGLRKSDVIKILSKFGNPAILATDRTPPPKKIEKIAAAFSAKVASPKENLRRTEKTELVSSYFNSSEQNPPKSLDSHKKDSLAAALFTWNRIKPIVQRIDKKLEIYRQRPDYKEFDSYVKARVLLSGESIDSSINLFLKEKGLGKRKLQLKEKL